MSYESNPKKSKKARRVRRPLPSYGELPRGRGVAQYRTSTQFCKEVGCNSLRAFCSSRCKEHTGKKNS